MKMSIDWSPSIEKFVPGMAFNAKARVATRDDLTPLFACVWERVIDIFQLDSRSFSSTSLLVEVELWLDTGRIVFILSLKREIARLVLNIADLEQEYYSLPDNDQHFEAACAKMFNEIYQALVASIEIPCVKSILSGTFGKRLRVVVRSFDDNRTDQSIR